MSSEQGIGGWLQDPTEQIAGLSKIAVDLLVSRRFEPYAAGGYLVPSFLADQLECTTEAAAEYLKELSQAGFLVVSKRNFASPELHFEATHTGQFAAEFLRRKLRTRQPALINQRSHKLEDLILAIAFVPHAFNARLSGGMLGMDGKVPAHWIQIYLGEWNAEDICATCSRLAEARIINGAVQCSNGMLIGKVELTPRGHKRYSEVVRQRLGLTYDECILDPPPSTLKVFLAWQSEVTQARNALWEAVPAVIEDLNSTATLLRKLELVRAKDPGEGAIRLDVALQEKIRLADFFIGDLTPVYAYRGRLRVNENVLVETGFALASKLPNRIVLMEMAGLTVPGDGSANPQPAFDIGHVHRLRFSGKKEARSKLRDELEAMLKADGWITAKRPEP